VVATIICCSSLREKFISYLSARLAQARSNCNCSRSCPTCLAAGQSLNFYGASLTLLSVADTLKPLRCTAGKRIGSLAIAALAATGWR
jgi:hypothetical protein